MSEADDAREVLTRTLGCSQCGNPFSERACGPTHAVIANDVTQHYLIGPLVREARAQVGDEIGAARNQHWRQHLDLHPYADEKSCPGCYAANTAYAISASIAREEP